MTSPSCLIDETYGAITEIKEMVLQQQGEDWQWGLDGKDSVEQTLFVAAFLASLEREAAKPHAETIAQLTDLAESGASSSIDQFLAFSLGLASCVVLDVTPAKAAVTRLLTRIRGNFDKLPIAHRIGLLFGCALFYSLLDKPLQAQTGDLADFVHSQISGFSTQFTSEDFRDSRVRYLYILSAFHSAPDELLELYKNHRADVEILRKYQLRSDERVLLLRPFSLLGIECHRTLIDEVMQDLKQNQYAQTQRRILHHMSQFFTYGEMIESGVRIIDEDSEGSKSLRITVSSDDVEVLRSQTACARYVATIGIGLITSGFSRVLVVPATERDSYLQFVRSSDPKYSRVEKERALAVIRDCAEKQYRWNLAVSFLVILASLGVGFVFFSVQEVSILVIAFMLYVGLSGLTRYITGKWQTLFNLVFFRKRIKEELRHAISESLGL